MAIENWGSFFAFLALIGWMLLVITFLFAAYQRGKLLDQQDETAKLWLENEKMRTRLERVGHWAKLN